MKLSSINRRFAVVVAALAAIGYVTFGASPAGAHGGPGKIDLVAVNALSDGGSISVKVKLTYVGDGDPVDAATVTVSGKLNGGDPNGQAFTPVTLTKSPGPGEFAGNVTVPTGGTWSFLVTSVEPPATKDFQQTIAGAESPSEIPGSSGDQPGDSSASAGQKPGASLGAAATASTASTASTAPTTAAAVTAAPSSGVESGAGETSEGSNLPLILGGLAVAGALAVGIAGASRNRKTAPGAPNSGAPNSDAPNSAAPSSDAPASGSDAPQPGDAAAGAPEAPESSVSPESPEI